MLQQGKRSFSVIANAKMKVTEFVQISLLHVFSPDLLIEILKDKKLKVEIYSVSTSILNNLYLQYHINRRKPSIVYKGLFKCCKVSMYDRWHKLEVSESYIRDAGLWQPNAFGNVRSQNHLTSTKLIFDHETFTY